MAIDDATIYFKEPRKYAGTNSSGTSFVHLLSPGRYHLEIAADGYSRQVQTVAVAAGACTLVAVELRGRNVSLDDLLCREEHRKPYPVSPADPASFCTISGKVVDADAESYVAEEQVYLAPYGIVANTDSTGTFVFRGLRPGTYCVTAAIPGYGRVTDHGISLTAGRSVTINLFLHQRPSALDE
jgi:hypothetical protein